MGKINRAISFIMAFMMIFTASPLASAATNAKATTTNKKLYLEFKDGTRVATVIRGSTINVKALNTTNYGLRTAEPVKIRDGTTNVDRKDEFNVIVIDSTDPQHEFSVTAKKPVGEYPPRKEYSLQGNYNSLQRVASAYCSSPSVFGTFEVTDQSGGTGEPLAIIRNSKVTLTYSSAEEKFTLSGVNDEAAGIFYKWNEVVTIKSKSGGTSEKDPLVYTLHLKSETAQDYFFKFYPNQRHKKMVDHDNDPSTPNQWDGKNYEYNYMVDSSYTIEFIYEESNQLMLFVEHPQNVLDDVVTRATNPSQGNKTDFIELKGEDNDFMYITDNMKLRGIYEIYGEKIDLAWEWIPNSGDGDKDVVKITGSQEWKDASVLRKENDVEGKLRVTATYRTNTLFGGNAVGEIDVLIYGRGTSAEVIQRSQKIGENDAVDFAENNKKLPNSKKMDMYKGDVNGYKAPINPYIYTLAANFGAENGYAHQMIIKSSNPEVLTAKIDLDSFESVQYVFGSPYKNPYAESMIPADANITLTANKIGTTKLEFSFYVKGNGGKMVEDIAARKTIVVEVEDTSPNDDPSLKSLEMKQPGKTQLIDFGFKPTISEYNVDVEYYVEKIVIKPTRKDPNADEKIRMVVQTKDKDGIFVPDVSDKGVVVKSGSYTGEIPLVVNNPTRILLTVTAENPNISKTYQINVMRNPPSTESGLKTLELLDINGKNYMTGFNSKTDQYTLTVPYSVKMLKPQFTTIHSGAEAEVTAPTLESLGIFQKKEWAPLQYTATETSFIDTTDIIIFSQSESDLVNKPPTPIDSTTYKITVKRDAPSTIATLDGFDVYNIDDKKIEYKPKFSKNISQYDLAIPYTVSKIVIAPKTTHQYATVTIHDKDGKELAKVPNGARSPRLDVPYITDESPYYDFIIRVTAENETTTEDYVLRVFREAPNDNALLKSLVVTDQNKKNIDIEYFQENFVYNKEIPYEVTSVTITPTAVFENVESIKVNNRKVESGKPSTEIKLKYPGSNNITVEVTAENKKDVVTYTINLTRQAPSSDARLKNLVLSDVSEFKPLFIANKTEYSAIVKDGAKGIYVTATANHPEAKITIGETRVPSGTQSELIEFIDVDSVLSIVVTAQDGKTTMTYKVKIHNQNLIEKTSNADLRNLVVNYGEITPNFKPSISEYDVAVGDDTFSVDIYARAVDKLADVKVYSGTREIGDENGNISEAISEGENNFTIKVTSSDKTKTREYKVNVFKNEDDKMGVLKPITADQIDFKSTDLIVVDIKKYSRVSADVFNTLKQYPEKRLIFIGNDYSLEFKGSDVKKTIPNTVIYDFGMKFTSPEEDDVFDMIYSDDNFRSSDDAVIVYFEHHGELPATATFTISLGAQYKNRTMYWNYYNTERERIDYYGFVNTNSKGSFSLKLDHMSTYPITTFRLKSAEDKSSGTGQIGGTVSGDKQNPATGIW